MGKNKGSSQKAAVRQGHYFRVLGRQLVVEPLQEQERRGTFCPIVLGKFHRRWNTRPCQSSMGTAQLRHCPSSCVVPRSCPCSSHKHSRWIDDRIRFDSRYIETCDNSESRKRRNKESNQFPEQRLSSVRLSCRYQKNDGS